MSATGELGQVLGNRVRELVARSNRIARRSAILVDSSRYRRSTETLVTQCAWCGKLRVGGVWATPDEAPLFLVSLLLIIPLFAVRRRANEEEIA